MRQREEIEAIIKNLKEALKVVDIATKITIQGQIDTLEWVLEEEVENE